LASASKRSFSQASEALENFLVRIHRVDHQSQYLLGFGLELFDLRLCFGRHGLTIWLFYGELERRWPGVLWGLRSILQDNIYFKSERKAPPRREP